jgi:hypothetical protein
MLQRPQQQLQGHRLETTPLPQQQQLAGRRRKQLKRLPRCQPRNLPLHRQP